MKRFTKIMVFATAIAAIALCLCSCARSSENKANYNEDSDNTISDYSDTQTETTSIPLNEYGFNNMDEWGDVLIEVTQNDNGGFVTSDNGDNYVTYNEGMGTLRFFPNNQMFFLNTIRQQIALSRIPRVHLNMKCLIMIIVLMAFLIFIFQKGLKKKVRS